MELPLGGPALRHYTQSRPRPHRQKLNYRPSRPQEPIIESENEVLELIGRVDEGVEEFFTKRVLPADTLKKHDEDLSITVQEVAPASATPCPPPAKTLRRKLGDFFTLKKRRGLKSETSQEGRPKKTSIADLIRPLREVARAEKEKDKEKVKESDKENEKEKEDHSSVIVRQTPSSGPPLRGDMAPPKRALREGKSQSLILLSGSAGSGTASTRQSTKKQYEGQHSFEQKLHLMLQRIGVSKAQPGEAQNQGGEMKKAESEGTIIDSKPEPAPSLTKPRTMSTSSDTRHQIRPSASAHESAGKPALLPKPVIKPAPLPTTAGHSTPESELDEIQEGDTAILSTQSPTKYASSPTSSKLGEPLTNTEATVSTAIPDLTNDTTPPTSTGTLSDTDICTASATPYITVSTDSEASAPITRTITPGPPTCTSPTSPTTTVITTTPTTTTSPGPITIMSSDSIASNASMTSSSTAMSTASITTAVSLPSNETSVCLTLSEPLTTPSLPMLNGANPSDTTPTAITEAVFSVAITSDTMSSFPAGTLNTISDCSPAVITASLDSTSSTKTVPAPSDTKIGTFPPSQIDSTPPTTNPVSADTTTARFDISEIFPISAAFAPFSTSPTTGDSTSPTLTEYKNAVCISSPTAPTSTAPTDISVTATSTSKPLPISTNTSNHKTSTCSTSNSTRPASIHFPLPSNSAPARSDSRYTVLLSSTSAIPIDSSTATLPDSTSPMPSSYSSSEQALPTPSEGYSNLEPTVEPKGAEDGEDEIAQNNQQNEMDESCKDDGDRKDADTVAPEKEAKEKAGADDKAVAKESSLENALSNKDDELCGEECRAEVEKQVGTHFVDEE